MAEPSPILIVEARFYGDIADELAKGAIAALEEAGVPYERLAVPGVFETPAAVSLAIRSAEAHSYAGFIVLGCVIRGETDHYEHICREASRALMDISYRAWTAARRATLRRRPPCAFSPLAFVTLVVALISARDRGSS